jgi:formyl-CoA transferase
VVSVINADGSSVLMPAVIPRLAEGATIRWAGQPLGASNQAVYCGLLGLSPGDLAELAANGII